MTFTDVGSHVAADGATPRGEGPGSFSGVWMSSRSAIIAAPPNSIVERTRGCGSAR
jgi:hypothetical protein